MFPITIVSAQQSVLNNVIFHDRAEWHGRDFFYSVITVRFSGLQEMLFHFTSP